MHFYADRRDNRAGEGLIFGTGDGRKILDEKYLPNNEKTRCFSLFSCVHKKSRPEFFGNRNKLINS
jgi:hypothetical protein